MLDLTDAHAGLVAKFTAIGTSLTTSQSYGPRGAVTTTGQGPWPGELSDDSASAAVR